MHHPRDIFLLPKHSQKQYANSFTLACLVALVDNIISIYFNRKWFWCHMSQLFCKQNVLTVVFLSSCNTCKSPILITIQTNTYMVLGCLVESKQWTCQAYSTTSLSYYIYVFNILIPILEKLRTSKKMGNYFEYKWQEELKHRALLHK